jgi:hypothetical protein
MNVLEPRAYSDVITAYLEQSIQAPVALLMIFSLLGEAHTDDVGLVGER